MASSLVALVHSAHGSALASRAPSFNSRLSPRTAAVGATPTQQLLLSPRGQQFAVVAHSSAAAAAAAAAAPLAADNVVVASAAALLRASSPRGSRAPSPRLSADNDGAAAAAAVAPVAAAAADAAEPQPAASAPPLPDTAAFHAAYELGELLGSGTYGDVRAARRLDTGEEVAVKIVCKRPRRGGGGSADDGRAAVLREAEFAARLAGCAHAARFFGAYEVSPFGGFGFWGRGVKR